MFLLSLDVLPPAAALTFCAAGLQPPALVYASRGWRRDADGSAELFVGLLWETRRTREPRKCMVGGVKPAADRPRWPGSLAIFTYVSRHAIPGKIRPRRADKGGAIEFGPCKLRSSSVMIRIVTEPLGVWSEKGRTIVPIPRYYPPPPPGTHPLAPMCCVRVCDPDPGPRALRRLHFQMFYLAISFSLMHSLWSHFTSHTLFFAFCSPKTTPLLNHGACSLVACSRRLPALGNFDSHSSTRLSLPFHNAARLPFPSPLLSLSFWFGLAKGAATFTHFRETRPFFSYRASELSWAGDQVAGDNETEYSEHLWPTYRSSFTIVLLSFTQSIGIGRQHHCPLPIPTLSTW